MLEIKKETAILVHKTCGLLNYLGGSFEESDFEKLSFIAICDNIFRNGGDIRIGIKPSFDGLDDE